MLNYNGLALRTTGPRGRGKSAAQIHSPLLVILARWESYGFGVYQSPCGAHPLQNGIVCHPEQADNTKSIVVHGNNENEVNHFTFSATKPCWEAIWRGIGLGAGTDASTGASSINPLEVTDWVAEQVQLRRRHGNRATGIDPDVQKEVNGLYKDLFGRDERDHVQKVFGESCSPDTGSKFFYVANDIARELTNDPKSFGDKLGKPAQSVPSFVNTMAARIAPLPK